MCFLKNLIKIDAMRKQCKRKVWKLVDPISYAINGACVTQQSDLARLRLRELSSLEMMVKGKGGIREWAELVDVNNLCQMMAKNGIGPEALPYCELAENELLVAKDRFEKTGKMGLSGVGINAIREVIEFADLQQKSIPRSTFEKMIDKTLANLRNKGRGVKEA